MTIAVQRYLVGGAVRDRLLGLAVRERDWVVTGATPAEMEALGYVPVGKDFPVFLHPETGEEHALARTERKSGRGYHGFIFHAAPEVTLEQDLARRDLTINAMAMDQNGRVIDPYGGRADLAARRLRHVGEAFIEDPLRVLRVARFAARLAPLGFRVDPETLSLMRRMARSGEIDDLTPERVWQEFTKALTSPAPARFFEVLHDCDALRYVLPELNRRWRHPRPRALAMLERASALSAEPEPRFAALMLGIAGDAGQVRAISERLRAPNDFRELAETAVANRELAARVRTADAGALLDLLERADLLRRPARLPALSAAWQAALGRGFSAPRLRRAHEAACGIRARDLPLDGLSGPAVGHALNRARRRAIHAALSGNGR